MSTKIVDTEKTISHPLEEVFNIEENTTVVPYKQVTTDLVVHEPYDDKDNEIESQLQNIYDLALEAFEAQQEEADTIDPKFKGRNAEAAVNYLRTALEAVREKSLLKQHKDKLSVEQSSGVTNNNLIVDRNEILRMLQEKRPKTVNNAVDGEFEEK